MTETQGTFYDPPPHLGSCGACRFWAKPSKVPGICSCRRYPPGPPAPPSMLWALSQLVWFAAGEAETTTDRYFDAESQQSIDIDATNFPPTHDDDWCGEFAALASLPTPNTDLPSPSPIGKDGETGTAARPPLYPSSPFARQRAPRPLRRPVKGTGP